MSNMSRATSHLFLTAYKHDIYVCVCIYHAYKLDIYIMLIYTHIHFRYLLSLVYIDKIVGSCVLLNQSCLLKISSSLSFS